MANPCGGFVVLNANHCAIDSCFKLLESYIE